MGLSKCVVKFQRSGCGFPDSGKPFFLCYPVKTPQNVVAIGQPGVGQRITGININCLMKVLNPLLQSFPGSLVPEVPAPQVERICLSIVSVPLDEKLLLVASEGKGKRTCNLFRYRVLQLKDVGASILTFISPKRLTVPDVNQTHANSYSVADLLDGALEDRFDIQVSACGDGVPIGVRVHPNRAGRPHDKLSYVAQLRYQSIGHTELQVFVMAFHANWIEGKYGDRFWRSRLRLLRTRPA